MKKMMGYLLGAKPRYPISKETILENVYKKLQEFVEYENTNRKVNKCINLMLESILNINRDFLLGFKVSIHHHTSIHTSVRGV